MHILKIKFCSTHRRIDNILIQMCLLNIQVYGTYMLANIVTILSLSLLLSFFLTLGPDIVSLIHQIQVSVMPSFFSHLVPVVVFSYDLS